VFRTDEWSEPFEPDLLLVPPDLLVGAGLGFV